MKIDMSLNQNYSLQLSTSLALDRGVEEIHDLAIAREDELGGKPFAREVQSILLHANKKGFFGKGLPEEHFLRHDTARLQRALQMTVDRHKGEYRESGYPYLAHVLSTAFILARLGFPAEVIMAGLLHDAVEDTPDKNTVLNALHAIHPSVAWYVFSVSGPDIKDAVEKDKALLNRIGTFSQQGHSLYPQAIKCADAIANLYDLKSMQAKDGRTAQDRQQLFLDKTRRNILPFAHAIDQQQLIPLKKRKEIFSLAEYMDEALTTKP